MGPKAPPWEARPGWPRLVRQKTEGASSQGGHLHRQPTEESRKQNHGTTPQASLWAQEEAPQQQAAPQDHHQVRRGSPPSSAKVPQGLSSSQDGRSQDDPSAPPQGEHEAEGESSSASPSQRCYGRPEAPSATCAPGVERCSEAPSSQEPPQGLGSPRRDAQASRVASAPGLEEAEGESSSASQPAA